MDWILKYSMAKLFSYLDLNTWTTQGLGTGEFDTYKYIVYYTISSSRPFIVTLGF